MRPKGQPPGCPFLCYTQPAMSLLRRLIYRIRQFWNALFAHPRKVKTSELLPYLTPAQIALFRRMKPYEQVHALQVLEKLKEGGQADPDLLTAALLHDVGKVLSPLSIFDRVLIVLGRRFFPHRASRWGGSTGNRLLRPFVVAAQHPDWSAELAAQAGASSRAVNLIRRHQGPTNQNPASHTERMLAALQAADDEN
jgi:hypothetical protein